MDAVIFLAIGIPVLCGIAYLIGHTHGRSATPSTVVVGAGAGGVAPNDSPAKADGPPSQAAD